MVGVRHLLAALLSLKFVLPVAGGWIVGLRPSGAAVASGSNASAVLREAAGPGPLPPLGTIASLRSKQPEPLLPPFAQGLLPPWVLEKLPDSIFPQVNVGPRVCSGLIALFFLCISCNFVARGREFAQGGGLQEAAEAAGCQEQEPDPEFVPVSASSSPAASRSATFHLLAAMATFELACSYALAMSGRHSPFFLPWRYCGRILATPLLVAALGLAGCASLVQVLPAMLLSAMAWLKLGLAAGSGLRPTLRTMLFFGGLLSGAFALNILSSAAQNSKHGSVHKLQLRTILDLASFCGMCYALVWLCTEGTLAAAPATADVLLNGWLDMLCIAGCGHLLLRRPRWGLLQNAQQLAAQ